MPIEFPSLPRELLPNMPALEPYLTQVKEVLGGPSGYLFRYARREEKVNLPQIARPDSCKNSFVFLQSVLQC